MADPIKDAVGNLVMSAPAVAAGKLMSDAGEKIQSGYAAVKQRVMPYLSAAPAEKKRGDIVLPKDPVKRASTKKMSGTKR